MDIVYNRYGYLITVHNFTVIKIEIFKRESSFYKFKTMARAKSTYVYSVFVLVSRDLFQILDNIDKQFPLL